MTSHSLPCSYVYADDYDPGWLSELQPTATVVAVDPLTFLQRVFATYGAVLYDGSMANGTFLPAVVTLCGGGRDSTSIWHQSRVIAVLDTVPMEHTLHARFPLTRIVLDTQNMWADEREATQYVATHHLNQTTSLAMQSGILLQSGFLADYIVGERLFAQYMKYGCIPATEEHDLLKSIVDASPWPRPVRVYGYNSMDVVFGGDFFEAETNCIDVLGLASHP